MLVFGHDLRLRPLPTYITSLCTIFFFFFSFLLCHSIHSVRIDGRKSLPSLPYFHSLSLFISYQLFPLFLTFSSMRANQLGLGIPPGIFPLNFTCNVHVLLSILTLRNLFTLSRHSTHFSSAENIAK
jgi:hypothetical protein